jgi:hypothetical protein
MQSSWSYPSPLTVVRQDSDAESILEQQAIQILERAIATPDMTQFNGMPHLPENSTAELQTVERST